MGSPLSLREPVINPWEVDPKNWISRQKIQPISKKTIIRKREFLKIYGLLKYFKALDLKWLNFRRILSKKEREREKYKISL